jgi:hypothetical protein
MNAPVPSARRCYGREGGCLSWQGLHVEDAGVFTAFLRATVRARLVDSAERADFEEELRGLATTGMAAQYLQTFLAAAAADPQAWEVGEALAECLLASSTTRQIVWPWNMSRDRRTPRASLPGADLVGFCVSGQAVRLLIGEVKTSADRQAPPNVMYGPAGMPWQLGQQATRLELQHAVSLWLYSRCRLLGQLDLFNRAMEAYLQSAGRQMLLVGILLRDTSPDERDVKNRAAELEGLVRDPTTAEVTAWYLPVAIERWPAIIKGGET